MIAASLPDRAELYRSLGDRLVAYEHWSTALTAYRLGGEVTCRDSIRACGSGLVAQGNRMFKLVKEDVGYHYLLPCVVECYLWAGGKGRFGMRRVNKWIGNGSRWNELLVHARSLPRYDADFFEPSGRSAFDQRSDRALVRYANAAWRRECDRNFDGIELPVDCYSLHIWSRLGRMHELRRAGKLCLQRCEQGSGERSWYPPWRIGIVASTLGGGIQELIGFGELAISEKYKRPSMAFRAYAGIYRTKKAG